MSVQLPLCFCCGHLKGRTKEGDRKCAAYPGGIPDKFTFDGEAFHITPEDGDNGVQFEVGGNEIMRDKEAMETYNKVFLPLMR